MSKFTKKEAKETFDKIFGKRNCPRCGTTLEPLKESLEEEYYYCPKCKRELAYFPDLKKWAIGEKAFKLGEAEEDV